MTGLSIRELMVLDVERKRWRYLGAKESYIREELGYSPTRYYQVLNALIDRPEAVAYDALLVNRLRRLRDQRAIARRRRAG